MAEDLGTRTTTEEGKSISDLPIEELQGGVTQVTDPKEIEKIKQLLPGQQRQSGDASGVGQPAATPGESGAPIKAGGDGDGHAVEPPPNQKPVDDPNQRPADQPPAGEYTDEQYFTDISEATGYEIKNDEDIVALVNHLHEKSEANNQAPPIDKYSPALQEAIRLETEGGDVRQYFSMLSVDDTMLDKLPHKELLRKDFMSKNATIAETNPDFAEKKFEREFSERYGILNTDYSEADFDTDEEYQKYLDDKEYLKGELQVETDIAKKTIKELRSKAMQPGPNSPPTMTEEESRQINEQYTQNVNAFVGDFEAIQIPLDPNGESLFNVALNDKSKPLFDQWLNNPSDFLEHIGISKDGKTFDVERLGSHIALSAAFSIAGDKSVGNLIRQHLSEQGNLQAIERRLQNVGRNDNISGSGGEQELTDEQEALLKFKELNTGKGNGPSYKPFYYPPEKK